MQGLRGLGADIRPGFRKHLKTKHRTQPRPPCTCLGFPAPLHFHHLESVAPFRDCQGDRASTDSPPPHHNTHTFPNSMLPVCADATGLPCVSAVGACLVKYSSPCQSALRSTS